MPTTKRVRMWVSAAILLVLLSLQVYSQESLGDVARHVRAEKQAGTLTSGPQQSSVGAPIPAPPSPSEARRSLPQAIKNVGVNGTDDAIQLRDAARMLLRLEKFNELEQAADAARSTKTRFPGGGWKLRTLYIGISEPAAGEEASDDEWTVYLDQLKHWNAQRQNSITARVALAQAYINYAWKARGHTYADQVSDDGWRLFHERGAMALRTLTHGPAPKSKCPEWYLAMQKVALVLSWDNATVKVLFDEASAHEPLYHYYYESYASYLSPRWHGEEGDSENFTEAAANRVGGNAGDWIYADVATSLICGCNRESNLKKMSWARIKRGFAANEELYGTSVLRQNQFAYLALKAGDAPVARDLFARIGDSWDAELWRTRMAFEQARAWASGTQTAPANSQWLAPQ